MRKNTPLFREFFSQDPVLILIGQSGGGKATQARQLQQLYSTVCPGQRMYYSETGALFREDIPRMSPYNKRQIQETQDAGCLQPWIIAAALWSHKFLFEYAAGPILFDGSPRCIDEAKAVINMFGGRKEILVFHLALSDAIANKRMIARNRELAREHKPIRGDTATAKSRKKKLAYFHTEVVPAIEYMKEQGIPVYTIDAQASPEAVTKALKRSIREHQLRK